MLCFIRSSSRLFLRPSSGLILRPVQRCAYSIAPPRVVTVQNYGVPSGGLVRVLALNRPEARNAISRQLLDTLRTEVEQIHKEAEAGTVKAMILSSVDDSCFCAGADLKERATFTQEDTDKFLKDLRETFTLIQNLPIPTISALSGNAFGGGLELALTTHMRVFASTVVVALPETRLAIIPGAGGTYRLPALIGLARARDLILTGRKVAAPEAYFLGLCDRLVEITDVDSGKKSSRHNRTVELALGLAREICSGGPIAIKAALIAIQNCALGEQAENAAYELVVKTKDRDEALAAFREKRPPKYKGH